MLFGRASEVQEIVEKFFGKKPNKSVNPDEVVALGFPYAGVLTTNLQVTTGAVSALSGASDGPISMGR